MTTVVFSRPLVSRTVVAEDGGGRSMEGELEIVKQEDGTSWIVWRSNSSNGTGDRSDASSDGGFVRVDWTSEERLHEKESSTNSPKHRPKNSETIADHNKLFEKKNVLLQNETSDEMLCIDAFSVLAIVLDASGANTLSIQLQNRNVLPLLTFQPSNDQQQQLSPDGHLPGIHAFLASLNTIIPVIVSPVQAHVFYINPSPTLLASLQTTTSTTTTTTPSQTLSSTTRSVSTNTETEPTPVQNFFSSLQSNARSLLETFQTDPAVEEARWSIMERFSRITRAYRDSVEPILQARSNTPAPIFDDVSDLAQWARHVNDETDMIMLNVPKLRAPVYGSRNVEEAGQVVDKYHIKTSLEMESETKKEVVYCRDDWQDDLEFIFNHEIHSTARFDIWLNLLGLENVPKEDWIPLYLRYRDRVGEADQETYQDRLNRIDKDIARTDPAAPFYRHALARNCLKHVLLAYSMTNVSVGYVQGMSDFAAMLVWNVARHRFETHQKLVEEEAFWTWVEAYSFWMLVALFHNEQTVTYLLDIQSPPPRHRCDHVIANFRSDQLGLRTRFLYLSFLLRFVDPDLYYHLERVEKNAPVTPSGVNFLWMFRGVLVWLKREFTSVASTSLTSSAMLDTLSQNDMDETESYFAPILRLWDVILVLRHHGCFGDLLVILATLTLLRTDLLSFSSDDGFESLVKLWSTLNRHVPSLSVPFLLENESCRHISFESVVQRTHTLLFLLQQLHASLPVPNLTPHSLVANELMLWHVNDSWSSVMTDTARAVMDEHGTRDAVVVPCQYAPREVLEMIMGETVAMK